MENTKQVCDKFILKMNDETEVRVNKFNKDLKVKKR